MSAVASPATGDPRNGALVATLFRPVPIQWLVYLRIAFGGVLIAFVYFAYAKGWNYLTKAEDLIYFPHVGFEWLRPLPPKWMHAPFIAIAVAGGFIAAGFLYRFATVVAAVAFGYVFCLDQSIYQHHLYLVFLLACLFICMPAHRALSIDALLRPQLRSRVTPAWTLYLIRFQLGVVYFYGGLAKLNAEWLSLRSVEAQLIQLRDTMLPALAPVATNPLFVGLLTWGGLGFDLLIVPLLLWRRTRLFAFGTVTFFHVTNAFIFPIDFFPWFMLAATAVFFPPDFPDQLLLRMKNAAWKKAPPPAEVAAGAEVAAAAPPSPPAPATRVMILSAVAAYVLFQILFPLRIYLYPGNVYWTGLGDNFSWQMRTMNTELYIDYLVTDRSTGQSSLVDPRQYLVQGQIFRLRTPEMYVHLAREIEKRLMEERESKGPLEIRGLVFLSLNRGEVDFLLDPNVDLTAGNPYATARRAVLTQEETWPVQSLRPMLARDLTRALRGDPWPSPRGPFEFERQTADARP